ncbi:MAG: bifunctional riboflavin kinase/FAD synthetase [Chlorobium sp.]|uniref:bifunctional riboflavin kinase/FAD synthetase n=1 Tax=Chlorobium sp. TaxID=1095 RepID=UPI0025B7AC5B|nr:bifunctional riboflavin kinase/FAD synthetase [Chlorobium sp.]MCF8382596.1 bifunctional riboflavin kinase/FAD synthetase [Chlorobium sp.]
MQVVFYHNQRLWYGDGSPAMLDPVDSAVTIGSFDGVHCGHRKIISSMLETARRCSFRSVVVTFDPHPRLVLNADAGDRLEVLTTLDEKIEQIAGLGIDLLVVVRFTPELAAWSSREFIEKLLARTLSAKTVTVGYDHGFGKGRSGSGTTLAGLGELFGFTVQVVEELRIERAHISSTRIRSMLKNGRIKEANSFLGAPYVISGKVVEGRKLGRELGFPTVNLEIFDPAKLLPHRGVYMATTQIEGKPFRAMMNIGTRPTLGLQDAGVIVEAHISGFSGSLYGKELRFRLHGFIRDEKKFDSLEALREQLEKDKKTMELFFE